MSSPAPRKPWGSHPFLTRSSCWPVLHRRSCAPCDVASCWAWRASSSLLSLTKDETAREMQFSPRTVELPFLCLLGDCSFVKKKGATRQRRPELRLQDLGKIWVSALAPRSRPLQAAPYAISGPHPSPATSPATVEEPRARTESRCANEVWKAPVACVAVGHEQGEHGFRDAARGWRRVR